MGILTLKDIAMTKEEAIKIIKDNWDKYQVLQKPLKELIPELRESEDEKIRKDIHTYIYNELHNIQQLTPRTNEFERWLSWLEKQKERNTAEKQDYSGLNDPERAILRGFLCAGVENVPVGIVKETAKDCIAHFPWPTKWNKEDERIIKGIIGKIDHDQTYGVSKVEMLSFLKSLRLSWKPSEEQMKQLKYGIDSYYEGYPELRHQRSVLESLYNDLKKLLYGSTE